MVNITIIYYKCDLQSYEHWFLGQSFILMLRKIVNIIVICTHKIIVLIKHKKLYRINIVFITNHNFYT